MNVDKKRKKECIEADCGLDKSRCLVNYGLNCIRLGGVKIPVQSSAKDMNRPILAVTAMKPYFIVDSRAMDEDWGD